MKLEMGRKGSKMEREKDFIYKDFHIDGAVHHSNIKCLNIVDISYLHLTWDTTFLHPGVANAKG
jgi:hypothetical protein